MRRNITMLIAVTALLITGKTVSAQTPGPHNVGCSGTPINVGGPFTWWYEGLISICPPFSSAKNTDGLTQLKSNDRISFTGPVTFTSSAGGGLKWEAATTLTILNGGWHTLTSQISRFSNDSHPAKTDYMWWKAGGNLQIGRDWPTTVEFTNKATNPGNTTDNFSRWEANANLQITKATVKFEKVNGGTAKTEWLVQRGIEMKNSKIEFINGTAPIPQAPLTPSSRYDHTLWRTREGSIDAENTPIIFTNNGRGYTEWYAQHEDQRRGSHIILHDNSPTTFEHATSTGKLELKAFYDITTGHNSPLTIKHKTHEYIKVGANRNNWTASPVKIEIDAANHGGPEVIWEAGAYVLIDSMFTFKTLNSNPIKYVKMQSLRSDLIVNPHAAELTQVYRNNPGERYYPAIPDACDAARAPVHFTLTGPGKTEWWAYGNILTNDTVHFHYDHTGNRVGELVWHADTGNIDTRRFLRIDYDSDNAIRFEALAQQNAVYKKNKHDINTHCYNGTTNFGIGANGNIRTGDSVIINRINTTDKGLTVFDAYNDIQTAMFNFSSRNPIGDSTNIQSRMGDIWLGYSWKNPIECMTNNPHSTVSFDKNRFLYTVPVATTGGNLNIKAGYDDTQGDGGNIYFTHIVNSLEKTGAYNTEISIPFSKKFDCNGNSLFTSGRCDYERSGIIGGVWRCQSMGSGPLQCQDTGLIHYGNKGKLLVDAGARGNIIINNGVYLNFQHATGSAFFRTRFGDIDLRNKTDVSGMQGSLLLLAQRDDLRELSKVGLCGCAEERNNVYLQDFEYTPNESSGSVFIGADNNIKLNYGGLQNKGTRHDPFLSTDYNPANPGEKIGTDYPCGSGKYHCDMVDEENQARALMLDFTEVAGPAPIPITQGGFAAVASDYIDVYKTMNYKGGSGSGMSSVPGTGTLHGENVAGYGLYMKTQGNKNNWNTNILKHIPKCPMGCEGGCDKGDYLHMVSRMTFHSDARIFANGQKVYLGSPVIEVFGDLELNTEDEAGNGTEIVLQADSLILHDSLIVSGNKLKYRSWSGINGDKPIMKFGYSRRTPPVKEYKYKDTECAPCYSYIAGSTDPQHTLDTITIKFKQGDAYVERFNTVVFDHTVLTFVTDSFDHAQGPPILDARFFIDTMKVRNQVVLYADKKHTRNAHFELISEEQKQSKDYAGLYVRHYHMEPIGACGRNYSELWLTKLKDKALDVITTSTFGGFGYQHSDVHVETKAHLSPGFTSLRLRGQCYEQKCGTLKMKDLRLDGGAQLHFSVGTTKGINGEYSDAIDVEKLTTYGTVDVNIEVRPCERMMNRCYPIIYYKSQTPPGSLKNLNLVPKKMKIDGVEVPLVLDTSTEGVVYVCVGNVAPPVLNRPIVIPSVAGVTTFPPAGIAYNQSSTNFHFKAIYAGDKPMVVRTNRVINGEREVLRGVKNANGEYEYVIRIVQQEIILSFESDVVSNMPVDGTVIWSHGETIYIRAEREDIASIYSVAGQLVKRIELPEGDTSIPMQRGVYVVTLKDGSVHKVIVK